MAAFSACTGATREECHWPCEFIDGVCVPPQAALSQPLTNADVNRIREVMALFSPTHTNDEMRNALAGLNAGLNEYVRDVIRRNSATVRTGRSWRSIASDIMSTTLNDLRDISCVICWEELDHQRPVYVVECNFPVSEHRREEAQTLTPFHSACVESYRNSRPRGYHNCPACEPIARADHRPRPRPVHWADVDRPVSRIYSSCVISAIVIFLIADLLTCFFKYGPFSEINRVPVPYDVPDHSPNVRIRELRLVPAHFVFPPGGVGPMEEIHRQDESREPIRSEDIELRPVPAHVVFPMPDPFPRHDAPEGL